MLRVSTALRLPRIARVWRPLQPHRETIDRQERERLRQSVLSLTSFDAPDEVIREKERGVEVIKPFKTVNLGEITAFLRERGVEVHLHSHADQAAPFQHQILCTMAIGRARRALVAHLQTACRQLPCQVDCRDEEWMVVALGENQLCLHVQSEEANALYQLPQRWREMDLPVAAREAVPRKALKAGRAYK